MVGADSFRVTAAWDKIDETPVPGFGAIALGDMKITASINSVADKDLIEMVKTPATISAL